MNLVICYLKKKIGVPNHSCHTHYHLQTVFYCYTTTWGQWTHSNLSPCREDPLFWGVKADLKNPFEMGIRWVYHWEYIQLVLGFSLKQFSKVGHSAGHVRQDTWDKRCETGDLRLEMWDRRRETGDKRIETRDRIHETWDKIHETRDKKQDTGIKRQDTWDMR